MTGTRGVGSLAYECQPSLRPKTWNNGRAQNGGLLLQLLVTTWKGRKLWL